MFKVVLFETDRNRYSDRQVREEAEHLVRHRPRVAEGQVVRDLVDC